MKGLLKKDFLLLKSVALPIIAILVMLLVAGLVESVEVIYTFILWSLVIVTAVFNQDRFHRTEEFITSIPDGKIKAVKARYAISIIMVIVLSLAVFAFAGINSILHPNFYYTYVPIIVLITIAFSLLGFAIWLPITYRFGILKTSLISGMWSVGGMFAILFAIKKPIYKVITNYTMDRIFMGCGLLVFATLCLLYVSYIISIKAYLKREK